MDDASSMFLPKQTIGGSAPDRSVPGGASRYYAAAAYNDARFRHSVLEFVRHGWYRARAPEFGIDESFVALHCRRAQTYERVRDVLMLAVFALFAYPALYWLVVDPDEAGDILSAYAPSLVYGVLAAGVILFGERLLAEHVTTSRHFARDALQGALQVGGADPQNLVVYGGYSPFVGSGYNVGGWSFSVNLERTRNEFGVVAEAAPFSSRDLMGFVAGRIDRLHIPGLSHHEVLFADGRLVRDNAANFVADGLLRRRIEDSQIDAMADSPSDGTRSYLCMNVVDWSGEIVLSAYLRCKKCDTNLFLEASYFLLAPPKRSFFKLDEIDPQLRVGNILRLLGGSMTRTIVVLAMALFRCLAWAQEPIRHWLERRRIRRTIKRNPRFNFGAVTSIRELGMENYYRVYFQQLDKERHVKTTEQCTIDAIVEFLDGHHIDTSDIRDRRSAILNNGVIVAGGELKADNMAVGIGAKAMIARVGAKLSGSAGTAHPAAKGSFT